VTHPNGFQERIQVGEVTAKDDQETFARQNGRPSFIPSANYRAQVRREQEAARVKNKRVQEMSKDSS
jgi:hypothetical protein